MTDCERLTADISIHAAREGGDSSNRVWFDFLFSFQSTPPVKAATRGSLYLTLMLSISIHAAREGGDKPVRIAEHGLIHFNPRRP